MDVGTDEVVNMEVDVERNTLLELGAPFNEDLLLQQVSQSEGNDIDPRFGDEIMGVGPVEDLDEGLLDEEDPTRVIKVGKKLKVEIKAWFQNF